MQARHKFLVAATLLIAMTGAASAQGVTLAQAQNAILGKCGSGASSLDRDAQGNWHGYCGGARMMVDTKGVASPDTSTGSSGQMSEAQARSAILDKCSSGASAMSRDTQGNWHGYCGGARMMVDAQGKAGPDTGQTAGLTEAHARSIALDQCFNVSAIHTDAQGNWLGYCAKGQFKITPAGAISFN